MLRNAATIGAEVFFSDADRRYYLKTLAHYGDEFKLRVWTYCLMSDSDAA